VHASGLPALDQAGLLQYSQMLGDCGRRHIVRFAKLRNRALAGTGQAGQDSSPCWIGQGPEQNCQRARGLLGHRNGLRSDAGAERGFDDVPFETGGCRQDLFAFSLRHRQVV